MQGTGQAEASRCSSCQHARSAVADLGAGEILLNCIDNDGVGPGFDIDLVKAVSGAQLGWCVRRREAPPNLGDGISGIPPHFALLADAVTIPVIASSGAGAPEHFSEVFQRTRAAAALAAGIFHRREVPIVAVKEHMQAEGIPARTL